MTLLKPIGKLILFFIPAGKEMLGLVLEPDHTGEEYASLITLSFALSMSPVMFIYFAGFAPNNMQNVAYFFYLLSFVLWLSGWVVYLKAKRTYG